MPPRNSLSKSGGSGCDRPRYSQTDTAAARDYRVYHVEEIACLGTLYKLSSTISGTMRDDHEAGDTAGTAMPTWIWAWR